MEKEKFKILVIDVQTNQVLFECPISQSERAYTFAAEMEQIGLEIKVIAPTFTDTLTTSLGLTKEAREHYNEGLQEEFEQHEGSCCFENSNQKIQ